MLVVIRVLKHDTGRCAILSERNKRPQKHKGSRRVIVTFSTTHQAGFIPPDTKSFTREFIKDNIQIFLKIQFCGKYIRILHFAARLM